MNKLILVTTLSASTLWLMLGSLNAKAIGNMADITIIDRSQNRTLPVYQHKGHYYVAGKPGNTYQIHVENLQTDSIEAVISVDAVNVITGKTAQTGQNGYIFDSYDSYDIAGWRKSEREIAGFYFTEIADSYAARTGRSGNVGVIGVAIYNKKYEAPLMPSISHSQENEEAARGSSNQTTAQKSPAPTAQQDTLGKAMPDRKTQIRDKSAESKKLGTGHGAIESSYVTQVQFERASARPAELITIYYDSYKNLVAQGVIPKQKTKNLLAKPFLDEDNTGFVPDPS